MSSPSQAPNDLLSSIDAEVDGLFWCTEKDLAKFPHPFLQLDYLFEGLLSQAFAHQLEEKNDKQASASFYMSQNFGRPFFLMHIENAKDLESVSKQILNHVQMISKNGSSSKNFALICDNSQFQTELYTKLKKKIKSDSIIILI